MFFFSKKSRKRRVGRRLGFERLETREVLAGTVVASVNAGGVLAITGDAMSNEITIARLGNGGVQVQNANLNGTITTISDGAGNTSQNQLIFSGVLSVTINMGDGDDSVEISNITPIPPTLINPFPILSSGAGPGITSALQTSTQVNLGTSLTVDLGAGNDAVIANVLVTGTITIDGQTGQDRLSVQGSTAQNIVVQDNDTAQIALYNVVVSNNVTLTTGAGDDVVDIRGTSTISNVLTIDTNAGSDIVRLGRNIDPRLNLGADITNIRTDDGVNLVVLENVGNQNGEDIDVDMGANSDTVTITNSNLNDVRVNMFAAVDTLNITQSTLDDFVVDMGTGADIVNLNANLSITDSTFSGGPGPAYTVDPGDSILNVASLQGTFGNSVQNFEIPGTAPTGPNFGSGLSNGTIRVNDGTKRPPAPYTIKSPITPPVTVRPNTVPPAPVKLKFKIKK